MNFEFGVYSLGERIPDAHGNVLSAKERVENIIQMAKWQMKRGLMCLVQVSITD